MIFERSTRPAVQPAVGLSFADSLRTLLRQDRTSSWWGDPGSGDAQNAIQAALTGHLVFSTLHTNDAASAVTASSISRAAVPARAYANGTHRPALAAQGLPGCATERLLTPSKPPSSDRLPNPESVVVHHGTGCTTAGAPAT